jgi:hypothetical protein
MANQPRVQQVQPALGYLQRTATSHEAIRLIVAVDQSNLIANSMLPSVLDESNVSVLLKSYQRWYREHLLAKLSRAGGRALRPLREHASVDVLLLRL